MKRFNSPTPIRRRSGFTLMELLIVVAVILTLATVTIVSVNFANKADRLRAGARQIQSFIAGSRDRAIYKNEIRGIRLILDPNNLHTAIGMQPVSTPLNYADQTLTFNPAAAQTNDPTGATIKNTGTSTSWLTLQNRGLLTLGTRIEIPPNSGDYYTVASQVQSVGASELLRLNRPNRNYAGTTTMSINYNLLLRPMPTQGSEISQLPSGVVIDLNASQLPSRWRPKSFGQPYSQYMDILYTPTGVVIGDTVSTGSVHLVVADVGDVEQWSNVPGRSSAIWSLANPNSNIGIVPANIAGSTATPLVKQDPIVATLNVRTGNVSVHPVDPTNSNGDQIADDPYRFAETGEVSNQ